MRRDQISFLFLNLGHLYDHLFMLIFATVAALVLAQEWGMSYAALIPYATPGFVAFAMCAIPAGWLADKWSRRGMMVIFFLGIGASAILTGQAETPLQIGLGLFAVGVFAAIYHPVGLAMVVQGRKRTGIPLAVNGVFGNMGVALAALVTGELIELAGWRAAFVLPGVVSVLTGLAYLAFVLAERRTPPVVQLSRGGAAARPAEAPTVDRQTLVRVFAIIFFSTAIGGLIFQSTTFSMPKLFDERLTDIAGTASLVGRYAFVVFASAAFAQLVVGYLVDNYSIRTVFAWVAGLQAAFALLLHQLTGPPALFAAIALMLVVFGQIPINDVLIGRMTRSEWRSRVYSFRYIVTFSVTASTVPLIAWIHAGWGFALLFQLLTAAAALIFGAVLLLPRVSLVTGELPRAVPAE